MAAVFWIDKKISLKVGHGSKRKIISFGDPVSEKLLGKDRFENFKNKKRIGVVPEVLTANASGDEELKKQYNDIKKEKSEIELDVASQKTVIDQLEAGFNDKEKEITELKSDIETKDEDFKTLEAASEAKDLEITSLKSDIETKDLEITSLKSDIETKDAEIVELTSGDEKA